MVEAYRHAVRGYPLAGSAQTAWDTIVEHDLDRHVEVATVLRVPTSERHKRRGPRGTSSTHRVVRGTRALVNRLSSCEPKRLPVSSSVAVKASLRWWVAAFLRRADRAVCCWIPA